MLPNKIRLFLLLLATLLLLIIFLRFPKVEIYENLNPNFVLLTAGKVYQCEVNKIENCSIYCYEIRTATLLKLKPKNCKNTKSLKREHIITFKVLPLPYSQKGEIPVEILKKP
jgi:D-alanyl-lipoteichoic acid acyltransferase DltB (MBOAT superfamily)